ncbi:N-acetyltransferase [Jannaschia pagri]|uniref:N-acetyltransferase n=1 Tax=Jannaschia pagri TaxID=2829797 RepID=A0ABQ4NHR5_9RHOB|nr:MULTISPECIES: GNAT family N-acetyltransferase [unclassified Jannaschia]GIT89929.1 N-acetyltransferase [Jannaschia sp. AI_61]GIT93964.1 N-acetyltransferase [Jannaschia sp. AI_62]
MTDITREDGENGGRWVTVIDGHTAEMTYSRLGTSKLIVDHTGVPDALRGRGVGLALAERMVADARAEGVRVIALCPFVKAQAKRHPEWSDVIE